MPTRRVWRRKRRRPGAFGDESDADPARLARGGLLTRRLWRPGLRVGEADGHAEWDADRRHRAAPSLS
jgi:hypothetical protein